MGLRYLKTVASTFVALTNLFKAYQSLFHLHVRIDKLNHLLVVLPLVVLENRFVASVVVVQVVVAFLGAKQILESLLARQGFLFRLLVFSSWCGRVEQCTCLGRIRGGRVFLRNWPQILIVSKGLTLG